MPNPNHDNRGKFARGPAQSSVAKRLRGEGGKSGEVLAPGKFDQNELFSNYKESRKTLEKMGFKHAGTSMSDNGGKMVFHHPDGRKAFIETSGGNKYRIEESKR